MERNPSQLRELRCRYATNNVPFLLIGPFKLEEVSRDPIVILYHDVMYDKDMDYLKMIAKRNLRRAEVYHGHLATVTEYRIGKLNYLDMFDQHEERVMMKVEDMTGLDAISAETLQILNYGIGGYYVPHFDCAEVNLIFIPFLYFFSIALYFISSILS